MKLQQDFMDCIQVDKAIMLGSIKTETGTLILFDLIDYVKSDIATMDSASYDILLEGEGRILKETENRKNIIFKNKKAKDASEKRELEGAMLREDYQSCKAMLYFIQNLAYKQGWFQ